jgi:AcrR family transcriptional regulator
MGQASKASAGSRTPKVARTSSAPASGAKTASTAASRATGASARTPKAATTPRQSTRAPAAAQRKSATSASSTKRQPAAAPTVTPASAKKAKPATPRKSKSAAAAPQRKPFGREEIIESIIDATLSLWATQGPAELSMRGIAARADVNYGLVHRHFGTKDAVIRAAMHRVVARGLGFVEDCHDLVEAVDGVLPPSTGAHARLIAWSILQYVVDDVMPEEDAFLKRMRELGSANVDQSAPDADLQAGIKAGSLLAMLYGWRLFEPYLVRGLGLAGLTRGELNAYIREDLMRVLER